MAEVCRALGHSCHHLHNTGPERGFIMIHKTDFSHSAQGGCWHSELHGHSRHTNDTVATSKLPTPGQGQMQEHRMRPSTEPAAMRS